MAHYALRSWPWIVVALASIIIFPTLDSIHAAFPNVDPRLIGHDMAYPAMLKFLPHGFLGLMLGAMEAAYRSTIMTHLNWGSSYLVHDFWRRFVQAGRQRTPLRDDGPALHRAADGAGRAAGLRARQLRSRPSA